VWESSLRAGQPFIGRRQGRGDRAPSMADVEGASMASDLRRQLQVIGEGK
jgi:hypothetical protein